jgi:transcriptional regulator of acetoin/glycerol metabolism
MKYIANDLKSKKIKKLAIMLRELDINVYIYGNRGVGKSYLASFISGEIIENFDELKTFPPIKNRLIAIGSKPLSQNLKEKFNIQVEIELEDLDKREKDLEEFIHYFKEEVKKELKIDYDFDVKVDISQNLNSLKRGIYKSALCKINTKEEIISLLEEWFDNNYTDESSYNQELKIFDEAIIKSMKKKYKSKLQMAKHLKLNRATLSKKVEEIENKIN